MGHAVYIFFWTFYKCWRNYSSFRRVGQKWYFNTGLFSRGQLKGAGGSNTQPSDTQVPRSSVICTEEIANLWYEPLSVSTSERDGFPPGRFLSYQQCQLIYNIVLNMFQGSIQSFEHALWPQLSEDSGNVFKPPKKLQFLIMCDVLIILRYPHAFCVILENSTISSST